jgi:hypothetical protein
MILSKAMQPKAPPDRIVAVLHVGRPLYWEITGDGVMECAAADVGDAPAVTFDEFDYRIVTPRARTDQWAKRAFARECGEDTHVVNRSRRMRRIYGRPIGRLEEVGVRVTPGLFYLDRLMTESGHEAAGRVAGFLLGADVPGARRLALLYAFDASGELVRFQPAIHPESLELAVGELARASGIEAHARPPILFTGRDLRVAASQPAPYPTEPEWNGLRVALIHKGSLWALSAGICTSLAYDARVAFDAHAAQRQAEAATRAASALVAANEAALLGAMVRFAREVSLPARALIETAQRVWMPGGRVTLVSDQRGDALDLTLPMRDGRGQRLASVVAPAHATPPERLAGALRLEPPPGFTVREHDLDGEGNAIRIRFERLRPGDGLERIARR